MATRIGEVQSTSSVAFLGIEIMGDWCAANAILADFPGEETSRASSKSWNARKNVLLVASYIFYGAWNPPFALLLFATSALDFYLGARIAAAVGPRARKAWTTASVISNLSMLGLPNIWTSPDAELDEESKVSCVLAP